MPGGRNRLPLLLPVASLAAIVWLAGSACRGPRPEVLEAPVGFDAGSIQVQLESRIAIAPPDGARIAALVIVFPEDAGSNPVVTIDPVTAGSISSLGLLNNTGQALDAPGVYLEILDAGGAPVYLARVSDPTVSRGEGLSLIDAEADEGILVSASSATAGGSLGLRVPFVRDAIVEVFRVRRGAGGENKVDSPLLLVTGFPAGEIPASGWSFEVAR